MTGCWYVLKGQFYQESRFKRYAVSPAGAMGIAQVMPGTFAEIVKALRWDASASPFDPARSIEAGAYYDYRMWKFWTSPRPAEERTLLMLASYNAGAGNVLKAQRKVGGALYWKDISKGLPAITGKHSKETIDYVRYVMDFADTLERRQPCHYY